MSDPTLNSDASIFQLFTSALWDDLRPEDGFPEKRPLLAHYTTVHILEQILTNNEIWLSNPLFMNDVEEIRFGINQGHELVITSQEIEAACGTAERDQKFREAFSSCYYQFANDHVLNTYVFCLSEHNKEDDDGLLSMWRGYGANGNGVAIVFDTAQINDMPQAPLIIAKVEYDTTAARMDWLGRLVSKFAGVLKTAAVPDDKLWLPAHALFERIKLFAVFCKHRGFKEENEWRVVYLPNRDREKRLTPMFHYFIGPRGVEPKLKFKVLPIDGLTPPDFSLTKITERIILGPSISSPLARASMLRMLELLNHPGLKEKLRASTIPFRAIS